MTIEDYTAVEPEDLKQKKEDDRQIEPVASIYRVKEDNSQNLQMTFNKNEDLSEIIFLMINGSKEIREAVFDAMTAYLAGRPEMDCRILLSSIDAVRTMICNQRAGRGRSTSNVDWKLLN